MATWDTLISHSSLTAGDAYQHLLSQVQGSFLVKPIDVELSQVDMDIEIVESDVGVEVAGAIETSVEYSTIDMEVIDAEDYEV